MWRRWLRGSVAAMGAKLTRKAALVLAASAKEWELRREFRSDLVLRRPRAGRYPGRQLGLVLFEQFFRAGQHFEILRRGCLARLAA